MPRIESIDCIPYEVPYTTPLRMKAGDLTSARHALLRVRLDNGAVGISEAPERPMFYGETLDSITAAVSQIISPRLLQDGPHDRNGVHATLQQVKANHTAKAAVEMAFTDALARQMECTVAQLLGGHDRPMKVTHMVGAGTPAAMREDAAAAHESGIRAFKVKIGYGPDQDVAAIEAIRQAIGEKPVLYVDGNLAYSADESYTLLSRLRDEHGIDWAEEPYKTSARDIDNPPRMPVPLMVDETAISRDDVGRQLLSGRAQKISIKVARTGFGTSTEATNLARHFGAQPVLGSQGDAAIGTLAGLSFASAYTNDFNSFGELSYFTRLKDDITEGLPEIRNGEISHPGGHGIGVTVDADKLDYYRLDR